MESKSNAKGVERVEKKVLSQPSTMAGSMSQLALEMYENEIYNHHKSENLHRVGITLSNS